MFYTRAVLPCPSHTRISGSKDLHLPYQEYPVCIGGIQAHRFQTRCRILRLGTGCQSFLRDSSLRNLNIHPFHSKEKNHPSDIPRHSDIHRTIREGSITSQNSRLTCFLIFMAFLVTHFTVRMRSRTCGWKGNTWSLSPGNSTR